MKKIALCLILAALSTAAFAQETTALLGTWTGKLDLGVAKLTLVLHLEQANRLAEMAGGTGTMTEYRLIEETIAPEVLSDIAEWINAIK